MVNLQTAPHWSGSSQQQNYRSCTTIYLRMRVRNRILSFYLIQLCRFLPSAYYKYNFKHFYTLKTETKNKCTRPLSTSISVIQFRVMMGHTLDEYTKHTHTHNKPDCMSLDCHKRKPENPDKPHTDRMLFSWNITLDISLWDEQSGDLVLREPELVIRQLLVVLEWGTEPLNVPQMPWRE